MSAPFDPHPPTTSFARRDARELGDALRAGTTASRALVEDARARIAALDAVGPALHAMIALDETAPEVADRLDAERAAERPRSRLHGVPIVVKDNLEARGLPGTAGSLALVDRPVPGDSPVVARLREAGLVVLGATNLSEWANIRSIDSTSGWSAVGGLTANPWSLGHSAGGSSSGSGAALAAGYAPLAIGTETDGSITCPSSLNGVVGLKPTVGTLPVTGIVPISGSQDAPGPMARSVGDVAALFDVLVGGDGAAPVDRSPRDVTLGVTRGWWAGHDGTDAAMEALLETLGRHGVRLVEVEVEPAPEAVHLAELTVLLTELQEDLAAYLARRGGDGPATLAEVVAFNEAHADRELAHFGQQLFEQALATTGRAGDDYRRARAACLAWAVDAQLAPALADATVDALIAPTYAPAWRSDLAAGDTDIGGGVASTAPSIAGWPVLAQPLAVLDGLPVGVVLVGRPRDEARLLAVGAAVEAIIGLVGTDALRPRWTPRPEA